MLPPGGDGRAQPGAAARRQASLPSRHRGGDRSETRRRSVRPGSVVELAVQVDRGTDESEMAEGLREVAELVAGRADLFGVEAEVVAVGQHLLERQPGV